MASILKILAQSSPAATTLTSLYTCTVDHGVSISSLVICNTNATDETFRVSVIQNGEADTKKQYLYFDLPIAANDTFIATVGLSLSKNDSISVRASKTNIAFQLFGVEIN